ncbi:MAG: NUDIX hydrolase N-terminal domain-containing protein [Chloroflexota bacterium]
MSTTNPAQQLALWADQLRDLSAMGLRYAEDQYNIDRFQAIQEISVSMLALATGEPLDEVKRLLAPLMNHVTPLCVGDAAIINDQGQILLIQRADNQKWAMPGGAFEVGETPAEGAVREAFEEAGIRSEPMALVGVFDSRLCQAQTRHHMYQFVFLCRPLDDGTMATPSHANETLDLGWFTEGNLPEDLDPGHVSRVPEAFRVWRGDPYAFFDK